MTEKRVKYFAIFKNPKVDTFPKEDLTIEVSLKEILEASDPLDFIEKIHICCGDCCNENQSFCDCASEYEDFDFIEIIAEVEDQELTKAERQKIAIEECNLLPLETIGHAALLKTANFAIETGATNAEFSTKATFSGQRYALKMKITWEQIDE